MRRSLLLAIMLTACAVEPAQPAVRWDVGVRPVADGSDPAWVERVDAARDEWSAMLASAGCAVDPFDGSVGTAPVSLVLDLSSHGAYIIGWTEHDGIEVQGTPDDLAHYPTYGHRTLMHEMGHALGLVHVAPSDDATSVMHAIDDDVTDPDAVDVADACP